MSLTRILILAGAALAAIIAAVLVNGSGRQSAPTENVQVVGPGVLVAATAIPVGQKIAPENLAWRNFPEDGVASGMITKESQPKALEDLTGAFARTDIPAGSPIFPNQVVKPGDSHFMAAILAPGARAASLPIGEENAAGGFILPNDRVDVILTKEEEVSTYSATGASERKTRVTSSAVLRNIRVVAIDQEYKEIKEGEALKGATATLELWPNQVERLEKAKKEGTLALSLRSVGNDAAGSAANGAGSYAALDDEAAGEPTTVRFHGFSFSSQAVTGQ